MTAFHGDSGLLLRGQVLTLEATFPDKIPSFRVQFEYPVMFTGVIEDEDIAVHGEANISVLCLPDLTGSGESADISTDERQEGSKASMQSLSVNLKGEHVVTLHYFLDRKDALLDSLRILLDKYEGKTGKIFETLPEISHKWFQEQLLWTTKNIARTNAIICQLLAQVDSSVDTDFGGTFSGALQTDEAWQTEFIKICKEFDIVTARAQIPVYQAEEFEFPVEFLKICACCLAMLKKHSTEVFFRPKALFEFLEGKLKAFQDVVPVTIFIEKIGLICFGVD